MILGKKTCLSPQEQNARDFLSNLMGLDQVGFLHQVVDHLGDLRRHIADLLHAVTRMDAPTPTTVAPLCVDKIAMYRLPNQITAVYCNGDFMQLVYPNDVGFVHLLRELGFDVAGIQKIEDSYLPRDENNVATFPRKLAHLEQSVVEVKRKEIQARIKDMQIKLEEAQVDLQNLTGE